jgi:hypothetical protein
MDGYALSSPCVESADEAPGVPCPACSTCGARHLRAECPVEVRLLARLRRGRASERALCNLGDLDEVLTTLDALRRRGLARRGPGTRWEVAS